MQEVFRFRERQSGHDRRERHHGGCLCYGALFRMLYFREISHVQEPVRVKVDDHLLRHISDELVSENRVLCRLVLRHVTQRYPLHHISYIYHNSSGLGCESLTELDTANLRSCHR